MISTKHAIEYSRSKLRKKADNNTRDHDGKMLSVVWRAEAISAGERATTMEEETVLYQSCRQNTTLKQKKQRIYQQKCVQNTEESFRNDKPNLWNELNKLVPFANGTKISRCDEFYSHCNGMAENNNNLYLYYSYEMEGVKYLQNEGSALQWRHNELDGISNQLRHDCLLKSLFRRRSKKTRWCALKLVLFSKRMMIYPGLAIDQSKCWQLYPKYARLLWMINLLIIF